MFFVFHHFNIVLSMFEWYNDSRPWQCNSCGYGNGSSKAELCLYLSLTVVGSFGSHASEPMESWIVRHVSWLLSSSIVCHHCPSSSVIICGQSSCPQVWSHKHHILYAHTHMLLVYAHELLSQYNLYFSNVSHFRSFLYLGLLTKWLHIEPSYLVQVCICSGATHAEGIMQLWTIFLKL